jgi:hypothetical protein
MLERLSSLTGGTVRAVDGDIGTVEDFYFDDNRWIVRYAVVATGKVALSAPCSGLDHVRNGR